jgi:hypothetical protein
MITDALSFDDYQALSAISNTGLGKLAKTPATFIDWLNGGKEEDETNALRVGRIAHRAVLEPDAFKAEFDSLYSVRPKGMKFNTKEGKAWKANELAKGKQIIDGEDDDFIRTAAQLIAQHPKASQMLRKGKSELSITAELPEFPGLTIKCRVDFATEGNALVDLKSAKDASFAGFQKAIAERKYHRQGALYLDVCKAAGLDKKHFTFIAIEKTRPYLIGCYKLDEQAIHEGRMEYRRLLELYAKCEAEDSWPGYSDKLEEIGLPLWAIKNTPDPEWMKDEAA